MVLRQCIDTPTYTTNNQTVPVLSTATVLNPEGGITIFALNRDLENSLPLLVDLRSFPKMRIVDWSVMDGDLKATNTEENPDRVEPHPCNSIAVPGNQLSLTLPKASWNVIHLHPSRT